MSLEPLTTLAELIALPSVNPMGLPATGDQYYEHQVTDYLERLFRRLGWPYRRQPVAPNRENILAYLEGRPGPLEGGKLLLFEAHQDTVPVEGMTIPPWEPTVRDGRIYGRGACDIKGGMTAMLAALDRTRNLPSRPSVLLACTVNEEHGYTGALAVAKSWHKREPSIIPRRPDAAIIAEPTELNVVTAHKGAVRWRLKTSGVASHSSQPEAGRNAIYAMAPVLQALDAYQRTAAQEVTPHPLCGGATLSVGVISGGLSVNTIPAECAIEVDRRLVPGETAQGGFEHVRSFLAAQPNVPRDLVHEPPFLVGPPLADVGNEEIAAQLLRAARTVSDSRRIIGVPFGTDAATFAAAGVPSVVFGPGSIAQAHTADEWLALDQLDAAIEILVRFLEQSPV
ncbi:MAG: M20 family metallopeptidase [Planctomycetia bacterium]|nr:M20 family metallopeptidase [Planctomycetia bacterium]